MVLLISSAEIDAKERPHGTQDTSQEQVIEKYSEWLLGQPDLLAAPLELKGKMLACWCTLNACHGDVLA